MKKTLFGALFVFCVLTGIWGQKNPKHPDFDTLSPGVPVESHIKINSTSVNYETWKFIVRPSDVAVRIVLKNTPADLDLFIKKGKNISDYNDVDAYSSTENFGESILISRMSDVPLQNGEYYLDVAYQGGKAPVVMNKELENIPYTIEVFHIRDQINEIKPGEMLRDQFLIADDGMIRSFKVTVPEGEDNLRIDLFDLNGDLDLMVNYGKPVYSAENANYVKNGYFSKESIVISKDSIFPLKAGDYFITVYSQADTGIKEKFSISTGLSKNPAEYLMVLPEISAPLDELDRVLKGTVEVLTDTGAGSACVISETGYILTNFHVVQAQSGSVYEEVVVALNLSNYRPPEEVFKAAVVRYDEDLDLALLKVTSGIYGQEVPEDYLFYSIPLGNPEEVRIGEKIFLAGYPGVGGTGTRVPVTFTQGIVSGYDTTWFGRLIKTDGEINSGNSGGAALDEEYRLIGLPTTIIGHDSGQIGFIHPLWLVPQEWWVEAGVQFPPGDAE